MFTCAIRELHEETGLSLEPIASGIGDCEWAVFLADAANATDEVTLDDEHDRYMWCSLDKAVACCKPDRVAFQIEDAAAVILEEQQL